MDKSQIHLTFYFTIWKKSEKEQTLLDSVAFSTLYDLWHVNHDKEFLISIKTALRIEEISPTEL